MTSHSACTCGSTPARRNEASSPHPNSNFHVVSAFRPLTRSHTTPHMSHVSHHVTHVACPGGATAPLLRVNVQHCVADFAVTLTPGSTPTTHSVDSSNPKPAPTKATTNTLPFGIKSAASMGLTSRHRRHCATTTQRGKKHVTPLPSPPPSTKRPKVDSKVNTEVSKPSESKSEASSAGGHTWASAGQGLAKHNGPDGLDVASGSSGQQSDSDSQTSTSSSGTTSTRSVVAHIAGGTATARIGAARRSGLRGHGHARRASVAGAASTSVSAAASSVVASSAGPAVAPATADTPQYDSDTELPPTSLHELAVAKAVEDAGERAAAADAAATLADTAKAMTRLAGAAQSCHSSFFSARVGITGVDLARTSRAKCGACQLPIQAGSTRFEFAFDRTRPPRWVHAACLPRTDRTFWASSCEALRVLQGAPGTLPAVQADCRTALSELTAALAQHSQTTVGQAA
jgi:hypothetical protein